MRQMDTIISCHQKPEFREIIEKSFGSNPNLKEINNVVQKISVGVVNIFQATACEKLGSSIGRSKSGEYICFGPLFYRKYNIEIALLDL